MTADALGEQLAEWGRVAILETHGRRSGRSLRVAVGFLEDEAVPGALLVAAGGPDTDWALNLLADPGCRVSLEDRTWPAEAEPLEDAESWAVVRGLILRYGTPAERLGQGPAFRLRPEVARDK